MFENKVLGAVSLGLFLIAIIILLFVGVLIILPTLQTLIRVDAQVLFISSDVLALFAAVLGFFSRRTRPGKVGEMGGLVVFIFTTIFLSFVMIGGIQTQAGAF